MDNGSGNRFACTILVNREGTTLGRQAGNRVGLDIRGTVQRVELYNYSSFNYSSFNYYNYFLGGWGGGGTA